MLPHPLWKFSSNKESDSDNDVQVCLFVKDHSGEGHKLFKQTLKASNANNSSIKVIGISKLRSHYSSYESRRRLCDSHDLFCCDERIVEMLPKMIGKSFFR